MWCQRWGWAGRLSSCIAKCVEATFLVKNLTSGNFSTFFENASDALFCMFVGGTISTFLGYWFHYFGFESEHGEQTLYVTSFFMALGVPHVPPRHVFMKVWGFVIFNGMVWWMCQGPSDCSSWRIDQRDPPKSFVCNMVIFSRPCP